MLQVANNYRGVKGRSAAASCALLALPHVSHAQLLAMCSMLCKCFIKVLAYLLDLIRRR